MRRRYMNVEQENELLRKNIKDLQGQLRNANIKIKNLTDELHTLRKRIRPETIFNSNDALPSGWAMPPTENPDAPHLQKEKDRNE